MCWILFIFLITQNVILFNWFPLTDDCFDCHYCFSEFCVILLLVSQRVLFMRNKRLIRKIYKYKATISLSGNKTKDTKKATRPAKCQKSRTLIKTDNPKALHFLHIVSVVDLCYYLIVGNLIHKFLYYPRKLLAEAADTLFEIFKKITAKYVDI